MDVLAGLSLIGNIVTGAAFNPGSGCLAKITGIQHRRNVMSVHEHAGRCAAHCNCSSRRQFLQEAALLAAGVLGGGCSSLSMPGTAAQYKIIRACGPASKFTPVIKAAFVRRKGEYGMRWPGAVYDGEAARQMYTGQIIQTAKALGIKLELREMPIHTADEADTWLDEAKDAKPDGFLVLLLDRQEHAWPTAKKAADTGIPAVVWSPLGSSFTTNTKGLAEQPGCVIFSTDDTRQLDFGLKMLSAGARMRRARAIVIAGPDRRTRQLADLGIELQYIPAGSFIEEYNALSDNADIKALTKDYLKKARRIRFANEQDVLNGVKSYFVASRILEREQGDAISMDCLGALGNVPVSLPCIAWSRMNDDGIPAACEADQGAIAAHIMVQYLFDRPGFQQDPVADTADDTLIGAHCSCATRLDGFKTTGYPFDLIHHHGNRDAVSRTLWPLGKRVTVFDVLPGRQSELLISTGTVVKNVDVPPAGGCVVSVKVKLDGEPRMLTFPGMHQLFVLGNFKRELLYFCQLYKLKGTIV